MSSFNCEHCNTAITENMDGVYTTECEHYPLKLSNLAKRSPILALADILAGEFSETPTAKRILALWQDNQRENKEMSNQQCAALLRKENIEKWRAGFERYEFLRTLTPREYAKVWRRALASEGTFDEIVDEERRKKQ
mgnify:CR=1 FL=1